jgi:hypothetical protein
MAVHADAAGVGGDRRDGGWRSAFSGRRETLGDQRNVSVDAGRALGFAWTIAFGIAAVYLLVFVVKFSHNIRELGWISDYASGFTVPETLARAGTGGQTVLASSGQWASLWFGLLTARLPLHRALWTVAPTALFFITASMVGWSVAQLASRRAAALAVLIALVASPAALTTFMAAVNHNTLYPCTALTGAYLVWLTRGQGRACVFAFGVPALMGVTIGVCLASDYLVGATALIPLLLVAVLAGLRRDRRARTVALSALATSLLAVAIAKLTLVTMSSAGFETVPTPFKFAALSQLGTQAQLLFGGLKALFNASLGQPTPGLPDSALAVACEAIMLSAFLALLVLGAREVGRLLWRGRQKRPAETTNQLASTLHVVYWVGSAAGVCLAVWLTAEMSSATAHESYYATVILSVAAVAPLFISGRPAVRWLIAVAASIFFIAGIAGLTSKSHYFEAYPGVAKYEATIRSIAKRYDASTGYAGYWDASSLTWSSDNRVVVRPLMACRNPAGAGICPFYMERVPSWYVPKPRRTFLLADATEPWLNGLPEGLGHPLVAYGFGPIRMYVYPYDIASRLGPALDPALF